MADKHTEARSDENIFEILQKQTTVFAEREDSSVATVFGDESTTKAAGDFMREHHNLPGLQFDSLQIDDLDLEQAGSSSVADNVEGATKDTLPPTPKRPRLLLPSPNAQSGGTSDSSQSPESGKRRRVQHDYRRLSSSGYVDDYEKGKDNRFSISSDSDTSPVSTRPKSNNSSPKTKSPNPFVGLKLLSVEKQPAGKSDLHIISIITKLLLYSIA